MSLLSNSADKGVCFIVSAPAGTGKTTLVQMLVNEFPAILVNVSYTTRQPRDGEVEGRDYRFISRLEFEAKIASGVFLEYVQLYDDYYGSSKQWIIDRLEEGKHVILVIDTQGAIRLKEKIDAVYIFISPPSLEELKNRLSGRKTESPQSIDKRVAWASREMEAVSHYDYLVVNDDLQNAYQILRSIIIAETHRVGQKSDKRRDI